MSAVTIPHRLITEPFRQTFLFVLVFGLIVGAVASIAVGAFAISPGDVGRVLLSGLGLSEELDASLKRHELIVLSIRAPRTVMAILVGAALGLSGAVLQGVFRNPLADPTLVGVSSGAGFAAALMIVLGGSGLGFVTAFLGPFALPVAAFSGGLATTAILYRISTKDGHVSVTMMLLAGIAIGALAGAGTGILVFLSNDDQLRDLTFWLLGSVGGATWATTLPLLFLLPVFAALLFSAQSLNRLLLGTSEAQMMGVDVKWTVRLLVVGVALCVGAAVSVSGIIGFIGIVVPHIVRLVAGPDHRLVLPGSMLLGALLLLVADMVARTAVAPAELPIGIITALMGAPVFIGLLRNVRQRLGA